MHLINLEIIKQNHPLLQATNCNKSTGVSIYFIYVFWEKYKCSMDFQLTDPFHCVWAVEENLAQFSKDENWHLTQMPRLLQLYSEQYILILIFTEESLRAHSVI